MPKKPGDHAVANKHNKQQNCKETCFFTPRFLPLYFLGDFLMDWLGLLRRELWPKSVQQGVNGAGGVSQCKMINNSHFRLPNDKCWTSNEVVIQNQNLQLLFPHPFPLEMPLGSWQIKCGLNYFMLIKRTAPYLPWQNATN